MLEMMEKKVVEPVLQTSSPGFYNQLFLVPKRGGPWRPVIDLSALNRALIIPSFRMETSEQIMSAVHLGEWLTSLELIDQCILSRTHLPDIQEVSSLCGEGSGLSVHRFPVRTVDGSICLLETRQVCGSVCSYSRSFSPPIPRRLAPQSTHPF